MKQEDIKTKTIRARVTDREYHELAEYAKRMKWAVSDVIREAIRRILGAK